MVARVNDAPAFEGEQLVVVPSPFFSHRLTKGYDSPTLRVVAKYAGGLVAYRAARLTAAVIFQRSRASSLAGLTTTV